MTEKAAIVITSSFLATEVIWKLYQAYRRYREKAVNVSNNVENSNNMEELCKKYGYIETVFKERFFDVMFFSNNSASCRSHIGNTKSCRKRDCAAKYLRRIKDYLDSATNTLDVCMYFFTCPALGMAIINAHKRGVVIRMVIDETMSQFTGNQAKYFYKEGIRVRFKQFEALMHHKFVIIDNDILMTGSTNWTMNAFFGNFENVIVTNKSALVQPFVNEFERIWTTVNVATL